MLPSDIKYEFLRGNDGVVFYNKYDHDLLRIIMCI